MEISYQQIRDLLPASDGTSREPTDVREFFSISEVSSVRHAGRPAVLDLCTRESASTICISLDKILTVCAAQSRSTENIRLPVAPERSRWSVRSAVQVRVATVDLMRPLPAMRSNSLDIRALVPLASVGTYDDFYRLPPPLSRRAYRAVREALTTAVRASWRIIAVIGVFA
jgi:hypothetical protein